VKYRKFGQLEWQASCLGFGCMRLPTVGDDHTEIDEPKAVSLLRHAIERGVNYVDTAYGYHGGNSEVVLGRALQNGYRERVRIATKLPSWLVAQPSDFDRFLNEQRARLQVDAVDFYLLHGLDKERWEKLRDLGVLEWAERAIADGRIMHLGFSFHDDYQVFQQIVDAYDWTMCQIQHNYMDVDNQAGTRGLRYAAAKGLAVVIMGPLLGGSLVDPPPAIQEIWDTAPVKRPPADWGLRWLWNQPEVSVVLSGMSNAQQLEENLGSAEAAATNCLTEDDLALIGQVRERYRELRPIPCTNCRYCMPCPNGVDIPGNFRVYNQVVMYDKPAIGRNWWYRFQLSESSRAGACAACGTCEEQCPQSIPVGAWMKRIHAVMAEGQDPTRSLD
jgi:predicted aldo/keto reductase-like oxidoreductase